MKRIAIIDDESDARQSLRILINTLCPDVEIVGEADGVESGYQLICQTKPNGILLDISMEDGTGFDLLDKFTNRDFQIIFTTAHDIFALKAFRYHALDYLLKPINAVELVQSIDLIKTEPSNDYQLQINNLLDSIRFDKFDKITLNSQQGMVFVSINEIVRLESDASYTTFWVMNNKPSLVSRPMKEFEDLLKEQDFFKVHQSHIVNLSCIKKILWEDGGYALMEDGYKVPIARRRKDEFIELVKRKFSRKLS